MDLMLGLGTNYKQNQRKFHLNQERPTTLSNTFSHV